MQGKKDILTPKEWIFILEDEKGGYILFAPIHKVAARISKEGKEEIHKILNEKTTAVDTNSPMYTFFKEKHLLEFPLSWKIEFIKEQKRKPKLTISLTNKCNLRCLYCYSDTGKDDSTLPWETAKQAITCVTQKAIEQGEKQVQITFHGGGEAFMEYSLMKKCVEYARTIGLVNNLDFVFSVVTNATLINQEKASWMKDSGFTGVTISLDGINEVNDHQRVDQNGRGSFLRIMEGIYCLNDVKIDFSIRSTVTNYGVDKMMDFVNFSSTNIFPNKGLIHFEPLSICGRASKTSLSIKPQKFFDNYILAKQQGREIGVDVNCSLDTFKKERRKYCGTSYGTMVCVTPTGDITACSRVTKSSDIGSELFFYGKIDSSEHPFLIEPTKIERIIEHGGLPAECKNCYARWNCQGHCPFMRYVDKGINKVTCALIRSFLKYYLTKELDLVYQK